MRILLLLLVCGQANAATYYIDKNRGSDAAAGTSEETAWKETTKMTAATFAAGDTIKLACDSVWDYTTQISKTGATFAGSVGSRITVTYYQPTGVDCGIAFVYEDTPLGSIGRVTGQLPTHRARLTTVTGDWSWNSGEGAWEMTLPGNAIYGAQSVLLGTSETPATHIQHFRGDMTAFSTSGTWDFNSTKIYLRTTSSTDNPVTVFGQVKVTGFAVFRVYNFSAGTGSYTTIEYQNFEKCGIAVQYNVDGANVTNDTTNPIFRYSNVSQCAQVAAFKLGNATKAVVNPEVYGITANTIYNYGINASEYARDGRFYGNYFDGVNSIWSTGGAVYVQGQGAGYTNGHRIFGNYCTNASYGTGGNSFDGACYYVEQGCTDCDVYGNFASRAHYAIQHNTGSAGSDIYGNIALTDAFIRVGDAGALGATTVNIWNNSGAFTMNTVGTSFDGGVVQIASNFDVGTATIQNNAFSLATATGASDGDIGIEVDSGATGTVTQSYNLLYGFRQPAEQTDGTDITLGTGSLTSNPLWLGGTAPTAADGFRLTCSSPLRGAGTDIGRIQDYGDRPFRIGNPSIGAWEHASGDDRCTITARATITNRTTITPRTTFTPR